MAANDSAEIYTKVKKSLEGTRFEPSLLTPLSGGSVNWTYHATLRTPLEDGTTEVLVKHGERHMMSKPEVALTLIRCGIEAEYFRSLSGNPFAGTSDSVGPHDLVVRTPKYYHYDEQNTNQFLEYLPNGISLKDYILKYYNGASPEPLEAEARQVGSSLGSWLKSFTQWSVGHPKLRKTAAGNVEARGFRHMVEFAWLAERVAQYPAILGDAKDVFAEVEKAAAAEILDESRLQVVHGDFWTGNVLMPDAPIGKRNEVPMLVIDWEMAHMGVPNVDFGEMIAELYTIWLYKRIPAALWMMEAFVGAYGEVSQEHAFRTAVQVGAHVVCVTSTLGWGTGEEVEKAVVVGKNIIVHAWEKDRSWFEEGDLACMFRQAV